MIRPTVMVELAGSGHKSNTAGSWCFCSNCEDWLMTYFRLENLMLVPSSMVSRWCGHVDQRHVTRGSKDQDMSLYHLAMQQLPFDPEDEYVEPLTLRYYNHHGQLVEEDDDCHTYYECRYAPCIMMEKGLREFSICGRCQQARWWLERLNPKITHNYYLDLL